MNPELELLVAMEALIPAVRKLDKAKERRDNYEATRAKYRRLVGESNAEVARLEAELKTVLDQYKDVLYPPPAPEEPPA